MPGVGKTAQSLVATGRLEDSLHASMMTVLRCPSKTMARRALPGPRHPTGPAMRAPLSRCIPGIARPFKNAARAFLNFRSASLHDWMSIMGPDRINEEMNKLAGFVLFWLLPLPFLSGADDVTFPSGDITLHGVVYRPGGKGPFPAVVYNHGSAAGMISKTGFEALPWL